MHIKSETNPIDSAISRLEREIELLREYRTRLVADVVTGKLDVLEVAAHLPDVPPDTAAELAAETLTELAIWMKLKPRRFELCLNQPTLF